MQGDETDAFIFKNPPQAGGDHSAFPGAPVDAEHAATRPPSRFLLGEFVEHFVGGGVGDLSDTAKPTRRRGERDDHLEFIRMNSLQKRNQAIHFRGINLVELLVGFFFNEPILQYTGSMDDSTDRAEAGAHLPD